MNGKLTLKLDDLLVDSFDTIAPEMPKGTVVGEQQCTCPTACTCPGCPTCDDTCNYTCDDATCPQCPTCGDYSCAWTCAGDTCEIYTCDPGYCRQSQKYTNCNNICW